MAATQTLQSRLERLACLWGIGVIVVLCLVACTSRTEPPNRNQPKPVDFIELKCGDFLELLGKKPENLQFAGCEATMDAQLRVLRAVYRVPGHQAALVEKYLKESFELPSLRFMCCLWESAPERGGGSYGGHHRNRSGQSFSIDMYSDEALLDSKADWPKIPFFHVAVNLYLDEP